METQTSSLPVGEDAAMTREAFILFWEFTSLEPELDCAGQEEGG